MCNRAVTGCNSKFTVDSFSKLFLKNVRILEIVLDVFLLKLPEDFERISFFCELFKEVHHILFELFDSQSKGTLVQSDFVEYLNEKLG